MEKLTTLRPIGETSPREQRVESVSLADGGLSIIVRTVTSPDGIWKVVFSAPVGVRILDERDTPEFWHVAVEFEGDERKAVVYEVTSGGWMQQQAACSPIMAAGFYPKLAEYMIGGDTYCVSVLSESEPTISRLDASAAA